MLFSGETGEEAWIGRNMGLISCDERKLYVYHTPQMQARVNEIVGRFMRPETRDTQFATEVRFVTLSKSTMEQKGIEDIREPIYRYLHPIVAPANKPVIRTPGVSAYWVAKEDISKLNEGLADPQQDSLCQSIVHEHGDQTRNRFGNRYRHRQDD